MSEPEPSRVRRADNQASEVLTPHVIDANTLNNLGIT